MIKRSLAFLLRGLLFLGQAALIVVVTLVLAGAFAARQRPDLDIWHTVELMSEFRAGDGIRSLDDYLEVEERVFAELETKVVSVVRMTQDEELNRFARNSRSFPAKNGQNWNRTQVFEPDELRGGVLMLHGMTDSPYSMRHFALLMRDQGFYVVNLRIPGHGTIPAELARVSWQDWDAAVRVGAADVVSKIGPEQPFFLMGYSNGGSLALKFTLDSINYPGLRIPDRLFLISPMLGVSGMARFGKIYYWLGKLDYFHQAAWLDIFPEYDPHKYNSFPMNAPRQSLALTSAIDQQLRRMAASGALKKMPPVLTFQSLVDATVITRAIATRLYDRLPANNSELVIFDVNREGVLETFVSPGNDALLKQMSGNSSRNYALTIISNQKSGTASVGSTSWYPHRDDFEYRELKYAWPGSLYSLSHVALPFPPDDEIYGFEPYPGDSAFPQLGRAQMVGESGAMVLPASLFTRVRANPFHDYMERRIQEMIE